MNYERYLTGSIRDNYRAALEEGESLDLTSELALLRGTLAEMVRNSDGKVPLALFKEIRQCSAAIGKNLENARNYVPISFLPLIIAEIARIVREETKNDAIVQRIQERLASISLPASGGEARGLQRRLDEGRIT